MKPKEYNEINIEVNLEDRRLLEAVYFDATETIRHYDKERTETIKSSIGIQAIFLSISTAVYAIKEYEIILFLSSIFSIWFIIVIEITSRKLYALIYRQRARARCASEMIFGSSMNLINEIDEIAKSRKRAQSLKSITLASCYSALNYFIIFFHYIVVTMYALDISIDEYYQNMDILFRENRDIM